MDIKPETKLDTAPAAAPIVGGSPRATGGKRFDLIIGMKKVESFDVQHDHGPNFMNKYGPESRFYSQNIDLRFTENTRGHVTNVLVFGGNHIFSEQLKLARKAGTPLAVGDELQLLAIPKYHAIEGLSFHSEGYDASAWAGLEVALHARLHYEDKRPSTPVAELEAVFAASDFDLSKDHFWLKPLEGAKPYCVQAGTWLEIYADVTALPAVLPPELYTDTAARQSAFVAGATYTRVLRMVDFMTRDQYKRQHEDPMMK